MVTIPNGHAGLVSLFPVNVSKLYRSDEHCRMLGASFVVSVLCTCEVYVHLEKKIFKQPMYYRHKKKAPNGAFYISTHL
jgi:hypothetical protein